MKKLINQYTDIIHIQSRLLMDSDTSYLSLAQRQAIELINRYSTQLAGVARKPSVHSDDFESTRHELINLLTPIVGYIEMLSDGWIGALSVDQTERLNIIHETVYALQDVILAHGFQKELWESA